MAPRYKWLRVRGVDGGYIFRNATGEYYSWEEYIPAGWYKAFGEEMLNELNEILVRFDFEDEYEILQIKEKFGSLRWYDADIPNEAFEEHSAWLEKYEKKSIKTCISCGEPATYLAKGWIVPICETCRKENG